VLDCGRRARPKRAEHVQANNNYLHMQMHDCITFGAFLKQLTEEAYRALLRLASCRAQHRRSTHDSISAMKLAICTENISRSWWWHVPICLSHTEQNGVNLTRSDSLLRHVRVLLLGLFSGVFRIVVWWTKCFSPWLFADKGGKGIQMCW
jgi:hypothetical protein